MGNAQQVALERSYQYDASGNLTQRQDSLRGEQRFRYDPTGRDRCTTPPRDTAPRSM